jgi:hypothetical protein
MSRPDFAVVPRGRETLHEALQVGVALRDDVRSRADSEAGKMMLHAADLVEQAQRVDRGGRSPKLRLHCFRDGRRLQQARARCFWRVIALCYASANAEFLGQFERRLKEVHEEARG